MRDRKLSQADGRDLLTTTSVQISNPAAGLNTPVTSQHQLHDKVSQCEAI